MQFCDLNIFIFIVQFFVLLLSAEEIPLLICMNLKVKVIELVANAEKNSKSLLFDKLHHNNERKHLQIENLKQCENCV